LAAIAKAVIVQAVATTAPWLLKKRPHKYDPLDSGSFIPLLVAFGVSLADFSYGFLGYVFTISGFLS